MSGILQYCDIQLYVCMYVRMYVCICMYVCMYMYVYVCMYMYVCMYSARISTNNSVDSFNSTKHAFSSIVL